MSPLNLDELPDTLSSLRGLEAALLDHLVSIHYQLEDTKAKIKASFDAPPEQKNQLLAKRYMLSERKKLFQSRLEKAQAKMKEIKANQ